MSIFRRKKTESADEKQVSISDKIIKALNYTPVDYKHTDGFIITSEDALNEARIAVGKLQSIDEYISDFRDSFIESDTSREIEDGKRQYTNHIGSIISITEQAMDDKIKAESIMPMLENKIAENEKNIEYYSSLTNV